MNRIQTTKEPIQYISEIEKTPSIDWEKYCQNGNPPKQRKNKSLWKTVESGTPAGYGKSAA